jgi:hypothetical protein
MIGPSTGRELHHRGAAAPGSPCASRSPDICIANWGIRFATPRLLRGGVAGGEYGRKAGKEYGRKAGAGFFTCERS